MALQGIGPIDGHVEVEVVDERSERMRTPNPVFERQTPIQVIERGEAERIWRMIFLIDAGGCSYRPQLKAPQAWYNISVSSSEPEPAMAVALSEVDIWERIIRPRGRMSKATARRVQRLAFTDEELARMHELAARNRRNELTDEEEAELDHYIRVGSLLTTLKLRARRVLSSNGKP